MTPQTSPIATSAPRPQGSVKKVAKLLDYSERHIRSLCARGELEHIGRGRGFRIFLDSVAAFQARHRNGGSN
ncbi:helix-turn-helix domain-containing protein [Candidatus Gracilibacteria bacterium]|nr:helix-turn-helix domain-containing protein [Candidatus Gracilibacteria bacterium]